METGELAHEALLYADERHLRNVALPFLREGIDAGELVVSVTGRNDVLHDALGTEAGEVTFLDAGTWFARPSTTFASYQRFVDEHLREPGVRARVLAEAVWATRSEAEVSEWQRLESMVNLAFAATPMRIICCYDRRNSSPALQHSAARTHRQLHGDDRMEAGAAYLPPDRFVDQLERTLRLPPPPADARALVVTSDIGTLRGHLREAVAATRLAPQRADDAVLAVHELVTNLVRHSGGQGRLLAWAEDGDFVCELVDPTGARPPSSGGYVRPHHGRTSGWGLVLVRQLADLVHVRSSEDGSAIRLRFRAT